MVAPFLYSLAGGMLIIVATGRPEEMASRFLRLVGMIVLALACGVTTWVLARGPLENTVPGVWTVGMGATLTLGAGAIVLIAPLGARGSRTFRGVCAVSGAAGLLAAGLAAVTALDRQPPHRWVIAWVMVGQASGALLLGSVTVAWLLGHAYLTATKMTIAPLRHFSRWLSWSVAGRVAFLCLSLILASLVGHDPAPSILSQLKQEWLVLVLRVGVGLAALGAFAYMVSDCVRLRSTQSATGILYFGSIFAYIGELASQQILAECGWPL